MSSNPLQVVFAGTPEFAVPALKSIAASFTLNAVICQPDRPSGRGRKITSCAVKKAAQNLNVELFQPQRLSDQKSIDWLRGRSPDVMVVAAYGQLLSASVLAVPRFGCINIHASLLPRWRGAAPIQRAILAEDDYTGVTIMHMVRELDAGDMIQQVSVPIQKDSTAASLHDELALKGAEAIIETLKVLGRRQALTGKPQDSELVTYAPKLNKSEAEIDWSESASMIDRKVRAYNPVPVAFTFLGNKRLKVFRVTIINNQTSSPKPASTVEIENNSLLIHVGDGVVRLDEIQLEGGKRMLAAELLRSNLKLPSQAGRT